jgi:hypothetical protein
MNQGHENRNPHIFTLEGWDMPVGAPACPSLLTVADVYDDF